MQTKRAAKTTRKLSKELEDEVRADIETLIPIDKFLEAGIHIGSKFKTGQMRKFIYKIRSDGLCILDISAINERIKVAAKCLSRFNPQEILIVAARAYAQRPVEKLAQTIGAKYIIGRFIPGTLTNPSNPNFMEPKIVFTADPPADRQVIKEAVSAKVPVISLCDTSNTIRNIDLVIPANNKGKKSLALIYWLLTRELLKENGTIKSDKEFTLEIGDFEAQVEKERIKDITEIEEEEEVPKRRRR